GTTWFGQNGSVNTSLHRVTVTSVNSIGGRWTVVGSVAMLYIPHTLNMRKLSYVDGDLTTKADQKLKKWRMQLYQDSASATTLVNSGTPNSGSLSTPNLGPGTYIAVEDDSTGWLHLGTTNHGTSLGNTTKVGGARFDTLSFTNASPNSVDS